VIEAQDYFAILEAANDGTSETTRFRIKSDGNVGLDTTNPQRDFVVSNGGAGGLEFGAGDTNCIVGAFNRSNSSYPSIQYEAKEHAFIAGTSPISTMKIAPNREILSGNRSDNYLKASLSHAKNVSSGTCTTTFTVSLGSMNDWHMIIFNVYSSSTTTNSVTQGHVVAFCRVMHSSNSGFAGTSVSYTVQSNFNVSIANASGNSFDIVVATTNSGAIEQITHVDVIAGGNGVTSLTAT
jgi:hypothetical protein